MKRYIFRQHLPDYFDYDIERKEWEFETLEELLNNKFFDCWKKDPKFHKFSISQVDIRYHPSLMCELNEGKTWYVVGYLHVNPKCFDLPKWVPKKETREGE